MYSAKSISLCWLFFAAIVLSFYLDRTVERRGNYFSNRQISSSVATSKSIVTPDKSSSEKSENNSGKNPTLLIVASKEAANADPKLIADFYCNGTHDEITIQKALNLVQTVDGNGVVQLTKGTFTVNGNIRLQNGNILQGKGIDETIIQLQANSAPFTHAGVVRGFDVSNLQVKDLTIHGNRILQTKKEDKYEYGKYGFYCQICRDVLLENVRIMSFQGYGFDPHGNAGEYVYTERLTIRGCIAIDNGWDGFTIDKTKHTLIENSIARNNGIFWLILGRHGVNIVTGSLFTTVRNNLIENNGHFYENNELGSGIMIQNNEGFGTGHSIIENNYIIGSADQGIRLSDVVEDVVRNNIVDGRSLCISVEDTKNLVLEGNECRFGREVVIEGKKQGISVSNQPTLRKSLSL